MKAKTETAGPMTELVNDYDGDGKLDELVAKPGGPQLLREQEVDIAADTGELDYHRRSKPNITSAVDCNFNRGFGCFGPAGELVLQDSEIEGAQALTDSHQVATFGEVNVDGFPDLRAVAPNGDLWVLYPTLNPKPGPSVTITAATALAVAVKEGLRSLGARQVGPGMRVMFWLRNPGPLDLEWGNGQKKRIIATKPVSVELDSSK